MTRKFRILTIIICLMLLSSLNAHADGPTKIYGDKLTCDSGETVSYSVHIDDNPGLTAYVVSIACESDWLYFDDNPEMGNFTTKGTITSSCNQRQLNVMWYNVDAVSENGSLFTVDINISPSAPSGEYPILIAYSPDNLIDGECNTVEAETINGCLTVNHVKVDNTAQNANGLHTQKHIGLIVGLPVCAVLIAGTCIILNYKKKHNKEEK